ncbi:hypothetical protein CDAR_174041 [Caerostris darwini]|uniref:Uncharacterized protein n=1 Tax=Caerostris darwini TaxID=1538125 RepID=A0AAV4VHK9_9ARAC|nr:hypothetical protein CDAR_174041 [Caerostris darwini]
MCSNVAIADRNLTVRALSTNTCNDRMKADDNSTHLSLVSTSFQRDPIPESKTGELFSGEPGFLGIGSSTGGLATQGNFLPCTRERAHRSCFLFFGWFSQELRI